MKMINKIIIFLVIGIVLGISIILIIRNNNKTEKYIEGIVVDIKYNEVNKMNPTLLIENESGPYYVTFDKDIDLEKKKINITDKVHITTDGQVRESYPMQVSGYNIILSEASEKEFIEITNYFINSTTYFDEELTSNYYRFRTTIFDNKEDFLEFLDLRDIENPIKNNLDTLFEDNIVVASHTYMSSSPSLQYFGAYKANDSLYIQINISSGEIITDDVMLRGSLFVINKDLVEDLSIKTICEYIITE